MTYTESSNLLRGKQNRITQKPVFGFSSFHVYGILSLFNIFYKFLHFLGKAINTKYLFMAKYVQGTGAIKKLLINGASSSL